VILAHACFNVGHEADISAVKTSFITKSNNLPHFISFMTKVGLNRKTILALIHHNRQKLKKNGKKTLACCLQESNPHYWIAAVSSTLWPCISTGVVLCNAKIILLYRVMVKWLCSGLLLCSPHAYQPGVEPSLSKVFSIQTMPPHCLDFCSPLASKSSRSCLQSHNFEKSRSVFIVVDYFYCFLFCDGRSLFSATTATMTTTTMTTTTVVFRRP